MKKKAMVLLSGGLDGTVLLYSMRDKWDVVALIVDYGQRHRREVLTAQDIAEKAGVRFHVVEIDAELGGLADDETEIPDADPGAPIQRTTIVPARNPILLSLAFGVGYPLGIKTVAIAAHGGDASVYPDCRPGFIKAFNDTIRLALDDPDALVLAPFLSYQKADIVERGVAMGVPLHLTWSCYKGGSIHCGTCGACQSRKAAFIGAYVEDETLYAN